MQSAIYEGWVRHRRYHPKQHLLRYRVFMLLLDLAELDKVFSGTPWWSAKKWALACYRRQDFFGDPSIPLDVSVRKKVLEETGVYPRGPIRMLANLRYFGYIMNPISCYYCFDEQDQLQYIVAEVNNTPWNEKHAYVLTCEPDRKQQRIEFDKQFHVSPFNPMDMVYRWHCNSPKQKHYIHLQNWFDVDGENRLEMDATLMLKREEISAKRLNRLLWRYPLMTMQIVASIYWQAMRLFFKGVAVYGHPASSSTVVSARRP